MKKSMSKAMAENIYFPKLKVQVKGQIFTSKVKHYLKSPVKLNTYDIPGFSFGKTILLSDKTRTWNVKALIMRTLNDCY